jgi:hypothetical protein
LRIGGIDQAPPLAHRPVEAQQHEGDRNDEGALDGEAGESEEGDCEQLMPALPVALPARGAEQRSETEGRHEGIADRRGPDDRLDLDRVKRKQAASDKSRRGRRAERSGDAPEEENVQ